MSVKSILDKLGSDVKDVFAFIGSAKGQAVVNTAEGVIEAVEPGSAGFINLLNNWGTEILKTQAIATAAGAQTGSSAQKAASVLSAITPQALAFLQANGLPAPTAAALNAANTALVAFANALGVADTTNVATSVTPVAPTPVVAAETGTVIS